MLYVLWFVHCTILARNYVYVQEKDDVLSHAIQCRHGS